MKQAPVLSLILLILSLPPLWGAETPRSLRFIHREGEVLHADSVVDETVIFNGRFSHNARIEEFSVSTVREVDEEGTALLESEFRTVEQLENYPGQLEWISEERVLLERDGLGRMRVPGNAARPVLRNVPRFPEDPVAPGDSWSLEGEEVHVFRMNSGMAGPYRGSVRVFYDYLENRETESGTAALIALDYDVYLPVRDRTEPIRLITGRSHQKLLWDLEKGRPLTRDEEFDFMMMSSDGSTREFRGRGFTEYRVTSVLDRPGAASSLQMELKEHYPVVEVESTERGILLSLSEETGPILFEPESAGINEDQRKLLDDLARSLESYRDRDILITGHTAHHGTVAGRSRLSLERASAVARELFPEGRKGPGRLFLRGAGSRESLGSDGKDRRVEILILD